MHLDDPDAPLSPKQEAALQEEVERALDPYRGVTPPHLLTLMRERLEEGLRTNPLARQLLNAFTPREAVDMSGSAPVDGAAEDDDAAGGKGGA